MCSSVHYSQLLALGVSVEKLANMESDCIRDRLCGGRDSPHVNETNDREKRTRRAFTVQLNLTFLFKYTAPRFVESGPASLLMKAFLRLTWYLSNDEMGVCPRAYDSA